ncbi:hypothetical protein MPNT_30059 [Candidatus Methylacidithermus pantelleriae]|uniref:Uncharacterized protein n=1 Tax=Candidatus Methylacidithermus pantelleriae TaxID=2744239 RepID=A0A8J2FNY8_9BACT|nr:hypothetical protein MPNT_30059 [Candidatus Methylacidithermus pantelleriae]
MLMKSDDPLDPPSQPLEGAQKFLLHAFSPKCEPNSPILTREARTAHELERQPAWVLP